MIVFYFQYCDLCHQGGANLECHFCPRQYHFQCGLLRGVEFQFTSTVSKSICWECSVFLANQTQDATVADLFKWNVHVKTNAAAIDAAPIAPVATNAAIATVPATAAAIAIAAIAPVKPVAIATDSDVKIAIVAPVQIVQTGTPGPVVLNVVGSNINSNNQTEPKNSIGNGNKTDCMCDGACNCGIQNKNVDSINKSIVDRDCLVAGPSDLAAIKPEIKIERKGEHSADRIPDAGPSDLAAIKPEIKIEIKGEHSADRIPDAGPSDLAAIKPEIKIEIKAEHSADGVIDSSAGPSSMANGANGAAGINEINIDSVHIHDSDSDDDVVVICEYIEEVGFPNDDDI